MSIMHGDANQALAQQDIGVLYTHGDMVNDPSSPNVQRMMTIEVREYELPSRDSIPYAIQLGLRTGYLTNAVLHVYNIYAHRTVWTKFYNNSQPNTLCI